MEIVSKSDIEENIGDFFKVYFRDYLESIKENKIKIDHIRDISYPEVDFIFIFKFVRIELDHLKNIDATVLNKELRILFNSALNIVSSLIKFKKSYSSPKVVFRNNFTEFNEEAKIINEKFEKARREKSLFTIRSEKLTKDLKDLRELNKRDIEGQKEINHKLADSLQSIQNSRKSLEAVTTEKKDFEDKYIETFINIYKETSDQLLREMLKQIALFSFASDRNLWENAFRSRKIVNFFASIKQENSMNILKYMEFQLDHQTSKDDKGVERIKFRKKLISSIEKLKAFNTRNKVMKRKGQTLT